ncbi:MAG: hypothetical protein Q7U28_19370 [Aquabacterium sp.]|nr:hypothetical protein [Aquabacterium sp.]
MSNPDKPQSDPLIQMSVHSLPKPAQVPAERTRAGRIKMLLVMAACAAPVLASYFAYYVVKPQGRVNYGALVTPPKPLPVDSAMALVDLNGQAISAASLKGQWLLIVVAGGACDARCEKQLYLQRQLRETLGKDKDRIDRVWLVSDQTPVSPALLPSLNKAWVLRAKPTEVAQWLAPEAGQTLDAHIYLVDPRGDWMMRFPVDADPSMMKKDLARLLKASQFWDKEGR